MKGMLKPLLGHFLNDFMRRILERSYSMIDFRTNPGPTSDPALVTLAHQGAAAYREEFDLLFRREATHANAMWQADHTPLDVWLLAEAGKPAKPFLTSIEDDYSRMIMGYRLSFQPATALTTALTLRQAIWRKEDPRWSAWGMPGVFYTDHGSDFTSKHMEQVAVDIRMELVFSDKGGH